MSELKPLYSVEETLRIQTVKLNQQLNKLLEQNTQIIEITAERDNALAQNAELVAMVEAMRVGLNQAIELLATALVAPEQITEEEIHDLRTLEQATPTQHLRDRDAEVGRAGFVAGMALRSIGPCNDWDAASNQYAEKVRRGEVCLKNGD